MGNSGYRQRVDDAPSRAARVALIGFGIQGQQEHWQPQDPMGFCRLGILIGRVWAKSVLRSVSAAGTAPWPLPLPLAELKSEWARPLYGRCLDEIFEE